MLETCVKLIEQNSIKHKRTMIQGQLNQREIEMSSFTHENWCTSSPKHVPNMYEVNGAKLDRT